MGGIEISIKVKIIIFIFIIKLTNLVQVYYSWNISSVEDVNIILEVGENNRLSAEVLRLNTGDLW